VGVAGSSETSATGPDARARAAPLLDGAGMTSSISVFHSPQPGQRPSHFGDSYPQDWHTYTTRPAGPASLPDLATAHSLPSRNTRRPGLLARAATSMLVSATRRYDPVSADTGSGSRFFSNTT